MATAAPTIETQPKTTLKLPTGGWTEGGNYIVDCGSVTIEDVREYRILLKSYLCSIDIYYYQLRTIYTDYGNVGNGYLTFKVTLMGL